MKKITMTIFAVMVAFCLTVGAAMAQERKPKESAKPAAGDEKKVEKKEEPKKEEAKKEEPKQEDNLTAEEAEELFKKSMELHEQKSYAEAIKGFKRISDKFPKEQSGYTAAYNVACGYALSGDKKSALEWLEKSINNGFDKFDHIKTDTDLDSLREEAKYKELMNREPM